MKTPKKTALILGACVMFFSQCRNNVDFGKDRLPENGPPSAQLPGVTPPYEVSASEADFADRIEIRWSSVADATYRLHRKVDGTEDYTLIYSGTNIAYVDTTALPGQTYHYAVQSVNGDGKASEMSAFDSGWRAHSAGCAAKLSAPAESDRFARLRNGYPGADAVAVRSGQMLVSGAGRTVMLNAHRDIVGVWPGIVATTLTVGSNSGSIHALVNAVDAAQNYLNTKVYRLTQECEVELVVTVPSEGRSTEMALDSSENIYVSARRYQNAGHIFRYSNTGVLLNDWSFADYGGAPVAPEQIHWDPADGTLLIEFANTFRIGRYRMEAQALVLLGERTQAVIGQPVDMLTQGAAIISFVSSNGREYRIYYPTGLTGAAQIQEISNLWQSTLTAAFLDSGSGAVFVADPKKRRLLSCAPPVFQCVQDSVGVSPSDIAVDTERNIYVLHGTGGTPGLVTKLNRNGAHVGSKFLPDFDGQSVTGLSIEADGESLWVAAMNSDKQLVAKMRTDLTAGVQYTEVTPADPNLLALYDFTITHGPRGLVTDRLEFDGSGDFVSSKFVSQAADGSSTKLPDIRLPAQAPAPLFLETKTCGSDGTLLHQVTSLDLSFNPYATVALLRPDATAWQTLPWQAPWWPGSTVQHYMARVSCARDSGDIFTLDQDIDGVISVAQRDTNLNEIRRYTGSRAALRDATFAMQRDGRAAFAADSSEVYRFVATP